MMKLHSIVNSFATRSTQITNVGAPHHISLSFRALSASKDYDDDRIADMKYVDIAMKQWVKLSTWLNMGSALLPRRVTTALLFGPGIMCLRKPRMV